MVMDMGAGKRNLRSVRPLITREVQTWPDYPDSWKLVYRLNDTCFSLTSPEPLTDDGDGDEACLFGEGDKDGNVWLPLQPQLLQQGRQRSAQSKRFTCYFQEYVTYAVPHQDGVLLHCEMIGDTTGVYQQVVVPTALLPTLLQDLQTLAVADRSDNYRDVVQGLPTQENVLLLPESDNISLAQRLQSRRAK